MWYWVGQRRVCSLLNTLKRSRQGMKTALARWFDIILPCTVVRLARCKTGLGYRWITSTQNENIN